MTPFRCRGALKRRPEHGSVQNLELNVRFFPFRERTRKMQVGDLGQFPCAGVYAVIAAPGTVRTGDQVTIV